MTDSYEDFLSINESHLYLSRDRSLYIGRVGPMMKVSRAPAAFIVALDGSIKLGLRDFDTVPESEIKSVVLPAGVQADLFLDNSLIAIFILDYLGADLAVLKHSAGQGLIKSTTQKVGDVLIEPGITSDVMRFVSEAYLNKMRARDVFRGLESLVSERRKMLAPDEGYYIDPRIDKAIKFIRSSAGLNANIEEISRYVSLSVPRFTQLFRIVTGISVRRFKIWHRMYLAAELLALGKSFTEAAVGAGFSDYAHFSRSFTEMGGVAPSIVLNTNQDLHMDVDYRDAVTESKDSKNNRVPEALLI